MIETSENAEQPRKRPAKIVISVIAVGIVIALAVVGIVIAATAKNRAYDAAATAHNTAVSVAAEVKAKRIDLEIQLVQANEQYTEKTLPALIIAAEAPEQLVAAEANAGVREAAKEPRNVDAPPEEATEPPVTILLDLSDKVKVTTDLIAEAEQAKAVAEEMQVKAEEALASVEGTLADIRVEDAQLATAVASAATDALPRVASWSEAHPKAASDAFTAAANALETALEAYKTEGAQHPDEMALESALPLVHAHGDFVAAALALQKTHDDTVAAEAAAAQAAAEAEAAAAAQARAGQLAPPAPNTWSGNGGGSTPPASGGGSTPTPGGGTGGGTGGWTPPYIPPTPCEATNTCVNNNI